MHPRENLIGYAYEWKEGKMRRGEKRGEKGPHLTLVWAPERLIRPWYNWYLYLCLFGDVC